MERLLKHIYDNFSDRLNAAINQYMVDNFDFNDNYIEHDSPTLANIFMSDDEVRFDVKISNRLIKKKKEVDSILKTTQSINIYVNCKMELNTRFDNFEIIRVDDEGHTIAEGGRWIQVNGNLVPREKKYPMKDDVRYLLNSLYGSDAVDEFSAVPIRDIAEKLNLKIVEDYKITLDKSSDGLCVMLNEPVTVYDMNTNEPITKEFKAGTILIDGTLAKRINNKAVNFAIAHEIYHWLRHRYFTILRKIVDKLYSSYIVCRINSGTPDFKNDDKRVEIQADKFAGSILLCHRNLVVTLDNEILRNGYHYSENKREIVDKVLYKLSNLYQVNKMPLVIRYRAENVILEGFEKYIYDFNNQYEHYEIYPNDFFDLYSNNLSFKELIDSKKFVYVNNHVVIYDNKYVYKNKLTSKAKSNLKECCINFSYKFSSAYVVAAYGLGISKQKKEPIVDETKNKQVLDNALNRVNDAENIRTLITEDFKESLINLRKYRKLHQADLADMVDLSLRNYQNYEETDTKPKKFRLLAIINALHLPPDYGVRFYKLVYTIGKDEKIYVDIMNSLYMEPLKVWNKTLESKGYPPILTNNENE